MTGRFEHPDALRKPAPRDGGSGQGRPGGGRERVIGSHGIDRCFVVTEATLREVFYHLGHRRVRPEGMRLEPNMVLSGSGAPDGAGAEEVAGKTVEQEPETALT